jgi:hypothetical protein
MISCGSYTASGTSAAVNCGFEPQFIMVKSATESNTSWIITDSMRGMSVTGSAFLKPNASDAEAPDASAFELTATGFVVKGGVNGDVFNSNSNHTYIYMAIRRDNQAEVTDATKVFGVNAYSGNGTANRLIPLGFAADLGIVQARVGAGDTNAVADRIRGSNNLLNTPNNHPELTSNTDSVTGFDNMNGIEIGSDTRVNWSSGTYAMYGWKRAKSYFDIACYNGTGSVQNVPHSLGSGSPPEMMWVKARTNAYSWSTQHKAFGANQSIDFNSNASLSGGRWNNTRPTDVSFTLGTDFETNRSGYPYIAYLFATLAGVSKVSSVVHSGTTNVDAGFSNGSRFVLLKLIGSGSGWYIWNSVSGIASGNDPYLLLNSTAAEVTNTDYIDPYSAGFTLTSSFPAGTYIYYAIA